MNIGDKAALYTKFKIVSYNSSNETFSIAIQDFDNPIYIEVPVYLSALGVFLPINSFVYPGDNNPVGHPDYYKRATIKDGKAEYYLGNNDKFRINLEIDHEFFNINGKYYVINFYGDGDKATVLYYAQLKTQEQWTKEVESLIGITFDGEVIIGIVVSIFIRYTNYPAPYTDSEETEIYYFSSTKQAVRNATGSSYNIIVIIHDEGTDMEYEMPLELLKRVS